MKNMTAKKLPLLTFHIDKLMAPTILREISFPDEQLERKLKN